MRFVNWTIRLVVFLVLAAFAAKNTETATLRFYFDLAWQAPLVVLLLVFFAGGVLVGLLATVGTLLRQKRELGRLRRKLKKATAADQGPDEPAEPMRPPVIDG